MEDVSSRIVEKAISLGCQDAIADVITNRSYQIRFAQNEAVISNRWRESTASVFFVYDKRVLASDIKDLTQLDAAVERLVNFFFQAEDGIRDLYVTGVQTCALPI